MQRIIVPILVAISAFSYGAPAARSDDAAVAVIPDYVLHHRHWHIGDFYIVRQRDSGSYRVYTVVNRHDEKRHFRNGVEIFETGSGKSFVVYYDSHRRAVVKEMHFSENDSTQDA